MRLYLKNDKGYSLLLSICILLIFSILGLSLMSLTSSGVAKNINREETIQAQDLSDKGIDYVVKDIQQQLEKVIQGDNTNGKKGVSKYTFETEFLDMLGEGNNSSNKYHDIRCERNKGIEIDGENSSKTFVCIESVKTVSNEEKDKYKREVTFKSIGTANNKEHVTRQTVILGTDAVPDQLRYAVSSNDDSVYLYGGVDIKGDIKTANNLIIHDYGYMLNSSTANWKPSVYTRLKADAKSAYPKVILPEKGNLYITKSTSHINTESKILSLVESNYAKNYDIYESTSKNLKEVLSSKFFDSSNVALVTKNVESDTIDISGKVKDIYESSKYSTFHKNSLTINNNNKNLVNRDKEDIILIGDTEKKKDTCKTYGWWGCSEWNYIEEFVKGNFNITDNANIRGQYYVYGDLKISNSNLNSDAIIYVDGDVEITDSVLNEYGKNGTLILFATGKIKIINISKYSNTSSKIKGFFYSDSTLNIFGVLSNIEIQGGISANKIILSAIRGKYTSKGFIDNVNDQKKLPSRLNIIYDEELITQYTSFKRDEEEEFITSINDPETIERY